MALSSRSVLTVPNGLTMIRLVGAGVMAATAWSWSGPALAAAIAGLGATDWFDGYLARVFKCTSEFGRILDPVADRVLMIIGMVLFLRLDVVPLPGAVYVVLARETMLSIVIPYAVARGATPPQVTWWGKSATFIGLVLISVGAAFGSVTGVASIVVSGLWVAVASLSVFSAGQYLRILAR